MLFTFRLYPPFCWGEPVLPVAGLFGPSRSGYCFGFISNFGDEEKNITSIREIAELRRRRHPTFAVFVPLKGTRKATPLFFSVKATVCTSTIASYYGSLLQLSSASLFGSFGPLQVKSFFFLLLVFFLNKWDISDDLMQSKDANCHGGEMMGAMTG